MQLVMIWWEMTLSVQLWRSLASYYKLSAFGFGQMVSMHLRFRSALCNAFAPVTFWLSQQSALQRSPRAGFGPLGRTAVRLTTIVRPRSWCWSRNSSLDVADQQVENYKHEREEITPLFQPQPRVVTRAPITTDLKARNTNSDEFPATVPDLSQPSCGKPGKDHSSSARAGLLSVCPGANWIHIKFGHAVTGDAAVTEDWRRSSADLS